MVYTKDIVALLQGGGVAVIPTDTIYGIVARALDSKAVERVYEIRRRRPDKPCIILIADFSDLDQFGIEKPDILKKLWPGAVSVILPLLHSQVLENNRMWTYLHRGTNTLAFRLPANETLRAFLRETGPLIAPSANPEGMKPAITIDEARVYFEDRVDFYLPVTVSGKESADATPLVGEPSTLVEIKAGKVVVLRQGDVSIPRELL